MEQVTLSYTSNVHSYHSYHLSFQHLMYKYKSFTGYYRYLTGHLRWPVIFNTRHITTRSHSHIFTDISTGHLRWPVIFSISAAREDKETSAWELKQIILNHIKQN